MADQESAPVVDEAPVAEEAAIETAPETTIEDELTEDLIVHADEPTTEEPEAADEEIEELEEGKDTFDRAYVEKLRKQAADARVKARDAFEPYGGPEVVEQAVNIYDALRTPEGVQEMFEKAGAYLGYDMEKIMAGTDDVEDLLGADDEEDRPLTRREYQALQAERQTEAQRLEAGKTIKATLKDLNITDLDSADARLVLKLAESHLDDGDYDPERVAAAVRQGHADFEKRIDDAIRARLEAKKSKGDSQPKIPKSGPASGSEYTEPPKDTKEASARVRKRFGLG